jgi:hypothetical protein
MLQGCCLCQSCSRFLVSNPAARWPPCSVSAFQCRVKVAIQDESTLSLENVANVLVESTKVFALTNPAPPVGQGRTTPRTGARIDQPASPVRQGRSAPRTGAQPAPTVSQVRTTLAWELSLHLLSERDVQPLPQEHGSISLHPLSARDVQPLAWELSLHPLSGRVVQPLDREHLFISLHPLSGRDVQPLGRELSLHRLSARVVQPLERQISLHRL